ncbi:WecB/TagA/CpsF family glycosyltransferase [uncultured Parabacteroides sp.]|uniref:WecB/TagA/CpsF family glycosyltransferase n=1 Tax=uncultured Parabacteroides sp. TaxID=512312 RepID=UPI00260AD44A|nr:WecB/TagA/CpsF family glycosyltransferase [uncultured Parabacteroides sp.]
MTKKQRVTVNGLKIYPFTSNQELIDFIEQEKGILVAVNSKKIKGVNPEIRNIINDNIGYADGIGTVMALKYKGIKNAVKLPGCELWLNIVERFYQKKTFYLVGGKQEVIDETVSKLKGEFKRINIVGYRNGYIKGEDEELNLINDLTKKKPDIVFVAMGSPKQEYLMRRMFESHPAIYQGLGGSFDVYTNRVRRAPKWFSDHGLEGVYRAFWEPRKRLKGVLSDVWFVIALKTGKY